MHGFHTTLTKKRRGITSTSQPTDHPDGERREGEIGERDNIVMVSLTTT